MPKRLKVLIADDNRDAVQSLARLLAPAGHRILSADSGEGALETALRERPDVLILDVGMPDLSGREIARSVREQRWGQCALLLAISDADGGEDREASLRAGFDLQLAKSTPLERIELLLAEYAKAQTVSLQPVPMRDSRLLIESSTVTT
jgi:CheY-like chemotaxis protein